MSEHEHVESGIVEGGSVAPGDEASGQVVPDDAPVELEPDTDLEGEGGDLVESVTDEEAVAGDELGSTIDPEDDDDGTDEE